MNPIILLSSKQTQTNSDIIKALLFTLHFKFSESLLTLLPCFPFNIFCHVSFTMQCHVNHDRYLFLPSPLPV